MHYPTVYPTSGATRCTITSINTPDCYIENKAGTKVHVTTVGQRIGLSDLDVRGINLRYGCEDIGRSNLQLLNFYLN